MKYPVPGQCQCGDIRYEIDEPFIDQVICHCKECQKFSAAAFGITALVSKKGFRLLSGDLSLYVRTAESGNKNECYFCAGCGNRIYHVNPNNPEIIRLKPGTLEDTSVIDPKVHFWVKSKQHWVVIPEDHKTYETQPKM